MSNNLLTVIPADLFQGNPKLELIGFQENSLNFIGSNVLRNLKNLMRVDFQKNTCINERYPDTSIDNLVKTIRSSCNVNLCNSVSIDIARLQKLNKNLQTQQKAYDAEKNALRVKCPDVFTSGNPETQSLTLLQEITYPDDYQQKYEELKLSCDEKAVSKDCVCAKQNCASKTELVFRHKS